MDTQQEKSMFKKMELATSPPTSWEVKRIKSKADHSRRRCCVILFLGNMNSIYSSRQGTNDRIKFWWHQGTTIVPWVLLYYLKECRWGATYSGRNNTKAAVSSKRPTTQGWGLPKLEDWSSCVKKLRRLGVSLPGSSTVWALSAK